jgi:hypothetical protein
MWKTHKKKTDTTAYVEAAAKERNADRALREAAAREAAEAPPPPPPAEGGVDAGAALAPAGDAGAAPAPAGDAPPAEVPAPKA